MAVTQVQDAQPLVREAGAERKRIGPFEGLVEKIRSGRERSRTVALLESSLRSGGDGGPAFEAALAQFKDLSGGNRERVLGEAAGMFGLHSSFTFDSPQKVVAVTTLSVFVAEAAALMPKDAGWDAAADTRRRLEKALVGISRDDSMYKENDPAHAGAKLAAAVALWELGYTDYGFWEDRLRSPATLDFTITKMLEMPETTDFKEHGWHLLQKSLTSELAISIALNGSPKRLDFLTSMMVDNDLKAVTSAMEGAIYLYPLPREFLDMAAEAAGRSGELNCKARFFIAAAQARPLLEAAGDVQYMAASSLIELYGRGMRHLGLMLENDVFGEMKDVFDDPPGGSEEAQAMERAKAASVIFQLHMAGIRTEGFTFKEEG